ncbi:MAG: HAD-IIIA family hydrolase [Actinomycetota bacterium]|nr:HAD-IIIA family hydrolase [Actinomycetota bacterium]
MFLDRDGVVVENRAEYVRSWDEVRFLPGAFEALRELATARWTTVLVTNQSAVGRGVMSLRRAWETNDRIVEAIRAEGGLVEATYMCPHRPDECCPCRKPAPGMLLQAASELDLDLWASFLVGDSLTDAGAARVAGVRPVLVLTGRGHQEEARMIEAERASVPVVPDLAAAVEHILVTTGVRR